MPLIPKKLRGKTVYCPQPNDLGYSYRIGTIAVGTIVYIQAQMSPPGSIRTPPVRRNPWIVEAWENRPTTPVVRTDRKSCSAPAVTPPSFAVYAMAEFDPSPTRILLACIDAGFTKP